MSVKMSSKGLRGIKVMLKSFKRNVVDEGMAFAEVYSDGSKDLPYTPSNRRKQHDSGRDDVFYAQYYECGNKYWRGSHLLRLTIPMAEEAGLKALGDLPFPFTKAEASTAMKKLVKDVYAHIYLFTNHRSTALRESWAISLPTFNGTSEPGWQCDKD